MQRNQPILTGRWDDNQSWEFYLDAEPPELLLCTAVYCLAVIAHSGNVVLARNHRGWEMLGGHIEPGETVEQALLRECLEEGGYTPDRYTLFGYRKINSKIPIVHSQRDGYYPFPHGYIPHFVAVSSQPLQKPTGAEIVESREFSPDELRTLGMEQELLIELGLQFYRSHYAAV